MFYSLFFPCDETQRQENQNKPHLYDVLLFPIGLCWNREIWTESSSRTKGGRETMHTPSPILTGGTSHPERGEDMGLQRRLGQRGTLGMWPS